MILALMACAVTSHTKIVATALSAFEDASREWTLAKGLHVATVTLAKGLYVATSTFALWKITKKIQMITTRIKIQYR